MENICKAFVKFQSEFKGMKPDSSNPFFKSTYISLDGILETTRPILAKNGLAVLQEATSDGEYIFVKTKLIHESGEVIETEILKMKPQKNDPQSMGSCITYSKRYQLAALLGICECIDDDANIATFGNTPQGSTKGNNFSQRSNQQNNKNLTEAQINRLKAISKAAGYSIDKLTSVIKQKYNKKLEELTREEYDHICNSLEKK